MRRTNCTHRHCYLFRCVEDGFRRVSCGLRTYGNDCAPPARGPKEGKRRLIWLHIIPLDYYQGIYYCHATAKTKNVHPRQQAKRKTKPPRRLWAVSRWMSAWLTQGGSIRRQYLLLRLAALLRMYSNPRGDNCCCGQTGGNPAS